METIVLTQRKERDELILMLRDKNFIYLSSSTIEKCGYKL